MAELATNYRCPYAHTSRISPNNIAFWRIETIESVGSFHTAIRETQYTCEYHLSRIAKEMFDRKDQDEMIRVSPC